MIDQYHTIVIGGGQAGLAAGYYLKQRAINFVILDSEVKTGDQWRKRFPGLVLFTPNSLNQLPGFKRPTSKGTYQTKDEFADYLEQYSMAINLPIEHQQHVVSIKQRSDKLFVVTTSADKFLSGHIIIATGAFKDVFIPNINCPPNIRQLTVNELSDTQLEQQKILIVGDGATGRQVAQRLSANNSVYLSQGRKRYLIPEQLFSINTFSLLKSLGILRLPKRFKLAQWLKRRDPFPDTQLNDQALVSSNITLVSRLESLNKGANLMNGTVIDIDIVVWATGYKNKMIAIDKNYDNRLPQGIYTLGQPWQFNRSSGLIYGAQFDAKSVVEQLMAEARL